MKNLLLLFLTTVSLLCLPKINSGQIVLGPGASKFVLFTSSGAVSDNAIAHSHITGDVGTITAGPITGFGNVDGVMHPGSDVATTACNLALAATITQINAAPATLFPSGTMGSGVTFTPGVYSIPGNATLTLDLILDGQGVSSSEFIIKIGGTFGANTNARVRLINGALACHVYWKITGAVTIASLVTMRGNIISGGAINMGSGDSLEGRAFSTVGLINVDKITAFTPVGCSSPVLTGPTLPNMASIACYTIFSSNGALLNSVGTSSVIGDVGNNGGGSITGWSAGAVTGTLHLTADPSTVAAASDLQRLYDTLNAMVVDIDLLYPAQFGHDLVLTPHVYSLNSGGPNGPAALTDSLYLDAQGNANGVFVIKVIGGALTTSTYARVKLINGAQSKNVFWLVQGAVSINNYSIFRGNIVVSSGALNMVNTGVVLDGRALTMNGAITTQGLTAIAPPGCSLSPNITIQPVNQTVCSGNSAMFFVKVTGVGLTYQWKRRGVNLVNGPNISGATSDTLRIASATLADTAVDYRVFINGVVTDSSIKVVLTVNTAPIITLEPANVSVCALGTSVKFFVKATGTALTYQWRKGNVNLKDTLNVTGTKTDTLKINNMIISDTSSFYNVIVTGTCPPNDTSNNASLLLNQVTIISNQPVNKALCSGGSTYLSVKATGSGLTYQWRKGNVNLVNLGNISGATSDTLRINPATIADTSVNYYVIISGVCSPNDTSLHVALTVNAPVVFISKPINTTICSGNAANFIVRATGSGLTYQWKKGVFNLSNGGNISGATSDTLKINPAIITDTSVNYYVITSGTCSLNDTSLHVSLTVNLPPVITVEPSNQTACAGTSVQFPVTAKGTGLVYQWRKGNVNVINGGNISGATSDTLKINAITLADTSTNYYVIVSGVCAPSDSSTHVSLTVNAIPTMITQPVNQSACEGSSVSLSVMASGAGLTYQWKKGGNVISNGGNISGATSAVLTFNPVNVADTSTNYYVVITGTCTPIITSASVALVVKSLPIAVAGGTTPVCTGTTLSLTAVTVAGATYSWTGPNGFVSASQNPVLPNVAVTGGGTYVLIVTLNGCNSIPSNVIIAVNVCVADLGVVKTADRMSPLVGRKVVFTITTTNNGPDTANGVAVTEVLQNGFTYVSSTTTKGTYDETTGTWTIGRMNIGSSATLSITATVNAAGNYVNTAIIYGNESDGDMSNNSSTITLTPIVFNIPEGFSPNGDGINDLFVIRGIDYYPDNTFTIFNRWGNKVFSANPYENTWDGTSTTGLRVGGDQLPVGTYFYILDLGDGTDVYKGTIYLNK